MRNTSSVAALMLIILFVFFGSFGLFAQTEETEPEALPMYGLGDQMFGINLGLFIPLFFYNPVAGIPDEERVMTTNLTLGGVGSLEWGAYLTDRLSLGVELEGMFALSPLERVLIMIPITAKLSYFFRAYPFDFPIYLGAGINFAKLDEELFVGPILKPGFAAYWNINAEWAIGLRASYWWVPQIYLNEALRDDTRLGNFMNVSISALYHF